MLALDEALDVLSSFDVQQCRVVELRFFAGLNIHEAADALGVSTATVEREWAMAKAWLHQRLSPLICEEIHVYFRACQYLWTYIVFTPVE